MAMRRYPIPPPSSPLTVAPVVIYFGGERFIVDYDGGITRDTPVVAFVHSYLVWRKLGSTN